MTKKIIYISRLSLMLSLISCSEKCKIRNIEISELLVSISHQNNIKYCKILEKSMEGDNKFIRELSLLNFENAVGYDHGSVLVSLILNIGEEKYLEAIKPLNNEQKQRVKAFLEVGIEYGDNYFVNKRGLEEIFPKINEYLIK